MSRAPEESDFTRYYKSFPDYSLTKEQSREYLRRIAEGDVQARDEFIQHNMRLVMFFVLRYVKHDDPRAMDLVSEGTLGLYKAIDKFDLSRNIRFSTYATWWIKCKIRRALRGFKKERSQIIQNLSKQWEVARTVLKLATGDDPSEEMIKNYLQWDNHTLRTYKKFNDDRTLIGHLKDNAPTIPADTEPPNVEASSIDLKDKLCEALVKLSPVEEDIVRRYYGFGHPKQTYEEIGRFYGMTKEWVRQRENKSLRKLFILMQESQIPLHLFFSEAVIKSEDPSPEEEGPSRRE